MGENDVHNADNSLISYNTADALDARISLNCQDYDNAIACAQRTISKYALCSTAEDFANMWKNDEGSEIIFQPIQTKDERTNTYDAYISFSTANNGYSPDFIPTQGLIDLYEANDMRQYTYFAATGAVTNDLADENVVIFNKYPGNPALVKTSAQTEFYNMTKELRVGEMYLIAAEASYMKDGSGLSFLNDLRSTPDRRFPAQRPQLPRPQRACHRQALCVGAAAERHPGQHQPAKELGVTDTFKLTLHKTLKQ